MMIATEIARRELDVIPFDRDGMKSTGFEVAFKYDDGHVEWWNEYVDDNGELYYRR